MNLKLPAFPTEVFVAPHLERQKGLRDAQPTSGVFFSPPFPSVGSEESCGLALCTGDLEEQEITFRRPSFHDWAQNIDTMAAHHKYRQVSWEDAPCLGCLPLLCTPQWVLAGLGLSRLFWGPVFTRSRAPVHILVLSCSLSWENLDCHVTFFSI